MYLRPIERLQIDFSTSCNAGCLFCSRQDFYGNPNAHLPKGQTLSLALLQKAVTDPALSNLKEIFYCGNYGDALASPHIADHLNWLAEWQPKIRWNIHTNGSLGSLEFWQRLGQLSAQQKGLVKFSIDGLADTNHLYRKNVEFSRVMRNLRQFVENGGRAVWKFIEFAHNRHQIDAAKELANQMGCYRFELRKNYASDEESYLFQIPEFSPSSDDLAKKYRQLEDLKDNQRIDCRARNTDTLYLDFDGLVWPCCWIHDWKYSPTQTKRQWHHRHFHSLEGENFNSLAHFSLSEILKHTWFQETLPNSWEKRDKPLHPACTVTCSGCSSLTSMGGSSL